MTPKRWLALGAVVVLLAFFAWGRANTPYYYIASGAMEPTLRVNDYIWASPGVYRDGDPKRGDIAMIELKKSFMTPDTPPADPNETVITPKRIIGVPGDKVEMVNGRLYINGVLQKEPYIQWGTGPRYSFKIVDGRVYTRYSSDEEWARQFVTAPDQKKITNAPSEAIPPGKYFVLGDNRGNSNDSHAFGLIDRSTIKSRVTRRIKPNPREF